MRGRSRCPAPSPCNHSAARAVPAAATFRTRSLWPSKIGTRGDISPSEAFPTTGNQAGSRSPRQAGRICRGGRTGLPVDAGIGLDHPMRMLVQTPLQPASGGASRRPDGRAGRDRVCPPHAPGAGRSALPSHWRMACPLPTSAVAIWARDGSTRHLARPARFPAAPTCRRFRSADPPGACLPRPQSSPRAKAGHVARVLDPAHTPQGPPVA